jgi:mono/diheme cytochrome c family protein
MRRKANLLICLLLFAAALPVSAGLSREDKQALVRGEYLAKAADCAGCHRSSEPGTAPYSGGLAIKTPMGAIFSTNITPSIRYGIGKWSEAEFQRALTEGRRRDGALLWPAMPYSAYSGMSESDLHALWIYFRYGVAPVEHSAPETRLGFPFNWRGVMWLWNQRYLKTPAPIAPVVTPEQKRGYYLVEVLGHCSACHSPRDALQGEVSDHRFSGASVAGWHAPNITADPISGIGDWRDDELVNYLRHGHAPGKGSASGGMAEVVSYSLRWLNDDDLRAMVSYLRLIPAHHDSRDQQAAWRYAGHSNTPLNASNQAGETLWMSACATCHRDDGAGTMEGHFPTLRHNTTSGASQPDNLVMTILEGTRRQNGQAESVMPAFGHKLNDQQIADLTNYVRTRFGQGDQAQPVSAAFVAQQRAGGEKPLLLRALPWLTGGIVVLVILITGGWLWRRTLRVRNHQ